MGKVLIFSRGASDQFCISELNLIGEDVMGAWKSPLFLIFSVSIFTATVLAEDCKDCKPTLKMPLKFYDIVPKNYDKSVPPVKDGQPTLVKVKVSVLNIQFVDEEKQAFGVDIYFHQYWEDHRVNIPPNLNSNRTVIDNAWRQKLWAPDTYFKNLLDGKVNDIIIPYSYTVVNNMNELFFANRVSLKLICAMNLAAYPHDSQDCEITIMSLQHTNATVVLEWKEFEVTKNILLAQYDVNGHGQSDCTKTYKDIGTFSCLRAHIKLTRRLGYFLINKYIPCILIVCMSFVTFWIPAEAYPARVTLSVTSLLTIVTQQYQKSISVSYVIAINVWMLSCIGFVFLSLLEYAFVVAVMNQKGMSYGPLQKIMRMCSHHRTPAACENESGLPLDKVSKSLPCNEMPVGKALSHMAIDRASRFIFPLLFFIFCAAYWMVYAR